MTFKNTDYFEVARGIAVRTFLCNAKDNEQTIYDTLEACPDPYQSYVDDYLEQEHPRLGYCAWSPFSMESVAGILDHINNLIDDITISMNNHFNPPSEDDGETFAEAIGEADVINGVEHCPNCNGANYIKKGKDNGKQRYKCKDCGTNFYEQ